MNCSVKKANVAWPLVKIVPFGQPFSYGDIRSSRLDEGITVMMRTISLRDPDQSFSAYFSNAYYYELGPLTREPLTVMNNLIFFNFYESIKIYRFHIE